MTPGCFVDKVVMGSRVGADRLECIDWISAHSRVVAALHAWAVQRTEVEEEDEERHREGEVDDGERQEDDLAKELLCVCSCVCDSM